MFAKRSLGQNFLTNPAIARTIAGAATLTKSDVVLEIGPGKGILTRELVKRAGRVVAIEKDDALYEGLHSIFADDSARGALTLYHADALKIEPRELGLQSGAFKIVANIPYNITGALIRHFLSNNIQPSTMVLLVQKEVAERILARDGKESILSLSVKAYGTPSIKGIVKAGSFTPAPKVDSAILVVDHISRNHFVNAAHEARFFKYVKAGFAQKRKTLLRNFANANLTSDTVLADLPKEVRAEDVTPSQWIELARH